MILLMCPALIGVGWFNSCCFWSNSCSSRIDKIWFLFWAIFSEERRLVWMLWLIERRSVFGTWFELAAFIM